MFSLTSYLIWLCVHIQLIIANQNVYLTEFNYHFWYQENLLSNSKFVYSDRYINGISRNQSNIKSIEYHLITTYDIFTLQTKQIGDTDFFLLNLIRSLDINREYQNYYLLTIQANISTSQGYSIEQAQIHIHIADANDNDVVFDEDIYEKTISKLTDLPQLLFHFHATDADEVHHGQILYELSSSFNQTFALHPLTGEFYLISNESLQKNYDFEIYAYDRYRIGFIQNNMKSKAQVKLNFQFNQNYFRLQTISNEFIEFQHLISSYNIKFNQKSNWNLLNIHQEILDIQIEPFVSKFEIFVLKNSSINARKLFILRNKFYLQTDIYDEYNLELLICFSHRFQCQQTNYQLKPRINFNFEKFHFKNPQSISIDEDLPMNSYLTTIRIEFDSFEQPTTNYKLLNHKNHFYLHPKTGILRLIHSLKPQLCHLEIQIDVSLFNKIHSIQTNLEVHIEEINKYPPIFSNKTLHAYLPYQFQFDDYDMNSRISYYLSNCSFDCPFEIHPLTGLLKSTDAFENQFYNLELIAFDWSSTRHFETKLNIQIDPSKQIHIQPIESSLSLQTIYLHIGFPYNTLTYHLSEDTPIETIIDQLEIVHRTLPFKFETFLDLIINDTSIPFIINRKTRTLQVIDSLDREKQDKYVFEINLKIRFDDLKFANEFYQKLFITIYIQDVNDNIPICRDVHQHFYLNENQIQTNLVRIQAFDSDRAENGSIHYSLLNYHEYFTIDSFTGQIDVYQSINYEQLSSLDLYVIASDQGQSIQLDSLCTTIHLTIVDLNDNSPEFIREKFHFEIYADLPRESIFGQIYAVDRDAIDRLSYSIESNSFISIDERTGYLRMKSFLTNDINLTVEITDGLHRNQTMISIERKDFIHVQEPILLNQPAFEIHINRSTAIRTRIINLYQQLNIRQGSLDYIEIISDERKHLFDIDQQGSIRLRQSLVYVSNSSFWLSLRLTRYRANPPHCHVHFYFRIHEDNFHFPQCRNVYQNLKFYEYSITYPLTRIQGTTIYEHIQLEYYLKSNSVNEKYFSIDKHTGFIQFLPSIKISHLNQSEYFLTIQIHDPEHLLFVDCYLKMNFFQRKDLLPRFLYSPMYNLDLVESQQIRQRLFQIPALLNEQIYHKNLRIRYRLIDTNNTFLLNKQTGYVAAGKSLNPHRIYQIHIEAFTVVYRGKWRIVSARAILPIRIRILSLNDVQSSVIQRNQSRFHLDLLTTTKIPSDLISLQSKTKEWFILISSVEHTKYFHVNVQTGQLSLIRSLDELINQTNSIELHVNVTQNWIEFRTIKVFIRIRSGQTQFPYFPQSIYYTSISKTLPTGIEIARLTISNPIENCSYQIQSFENLQSASIFDLNSSSSSLTTLPSFEFSSYDKHEMKIIYYCPMIGFVASTRLYVKIFERKQTYADRSLIVFESSFERNQQRYLMNFDQQTDLQIIEGDPLGLFAINSTNQSLYLIDESLSRSYNYPIQLKIIDTFEKIDIRTFFITIFLSNTAIQTTCSLNPSPYLFSYQSQPENSLDFLTGQVYSPSWTSVSIQEFDPYSPWNPFECVISNSQIQSSNIQFDFRFEHDLYSISQPTIVSIKNRKNLPNPFDVTYEFVNQNSRLQLDRHTGLVNPISLGNMSYLIVAKYQLLVTLTRVHVAVQQPIIYKFRIAKPLIENYTIGFVKAEGQLSDQRIFSIDKTGRLFVRNSTIDQNFYYFNLITIRIEITIDSKKLVQCQLNRLKTFHDNQVLGFIETIDRSQKQSFSLLNYNHLFLLNSQYGLLIHRNSNTIISNELVLLIDMENARCLLKIPPINYQMIRKKFDKQSSNQFKLENGTLIHFDLVPAYAPIFHRKSYEFSVDLTTNPNEKLIVGQIHAEAYNPNRSSLVYELISSNRDFHLHSQTGILEYQPNRYANQTKQNLQIIARDLIYQQSTRINVTIHIQRSNLIPISSLVYQRTLSRFLSPGSIVFQPMNISEKENLEFQLRDSDADMFVIDSFTGQIKLRTFFSQPKYLLRIHVSPTDQILIVKLTIIDWNNHPPGFLNLPVNLSISVDDTFVTKLSAYDLDFDDNLKLEYYLLDSKQREIFSINQKTGLITMKTSSNQTFVSLKIGVSDDFHLTTNSLSITIRNYSTNAPKFSSNEYIFHYNQPHLGRISAVDFDPNDQLIYKLHLQPDGILIDPYSGSITIETNLLPPTIEFFASATDRAKQIAYTKIKILIPIQPKFTSNLYHIALNSSRKLPLEIFQFHLVDSFNRLLSSTRFEINRQDLFEIIDNKLFLNKQFSSQSNVMLLVNVTGFWKNWTCQSSIRLTIDEKIMRLNKKFYEFLIENKSPSLIKKFDIKNSSLKLISTPLTFNNCSQNFYIKYNELHIDNTTIRSKICFFELELSNGRSLSTSQVKVLFADFDSKPTFSSKFYSFSSNDIRVFAKSQNSIRYKLESNPYGFCINQTSGRIYSHYNMNKFEQIQLYVYAIDDKTNLNDTATISISFNRKKSFEIPERIPSCSNRSISISDESNQFYILSGDKYNLFSINHLGQIHLISPILNQTIESNYELIILKSSSFEFCRSNITINRALNWLDFVCPFGRPIQWIIDEELPRNTVIGNLKTILLDFNSNNSQLIDRLQMKFEIETAVFHLNSSTGSIQTKSRLDYEQQSSYVLSILLLPRELNCSFPLIIKLVNLPDNSIRFDQQSLVYNLTDNYLLPFVLGRIKLIDIDQINLFYYKFSLKTPSSDISIDYTSGSIILLTKFNRKYRQNQFNFSILAIDTNNQRNLTDYLILNFNETKHSNDKEIYFQMENIRRCSVDQQQTNRTSICTIGKESRDFHYELIDPKKHFEILKNNATIVRQHRLTQKQYNLTILVRDRHDQSTILSSLNLTVDVRNFNPLSSSSNSITLIYFSYPSINTVLYKIDVSPSNFTYEIFNETMSNYSLRPSDNCFELVLTKRILSNHEENLVIRFSQTLDYKFRLIFHQSNIFEPMILSQTIDGYINFLNNSLPINLGQLFIENHSQYSFVYFQLQDNNEQFYLKQLSNNQTELYFQPRYSSIFVEFDIHLTAFAVQKPIPNIDFSTNTKIFFANQTKSQTISVHFWSINHEMFDRTISLIINLNSTITYDQFIIEKLPLIRENLADILDVDIINVHIYTFQLQNNQIELLVAIQRSSSDRFLHKKLIYNALKNTTAIFDRISINQCHEISCQNHGHCTSSIHFLTNQYEYFSSNTYHRLIPKYQWNTKCLCSDSFYGQYCQLKHDEYSSCSSNPCLPREICIEESTNSYSCQCVDDLCEMKNMLKCLNNHSATCRDSMNTLTFDGYSSIRMNVTSNSMMMMIRFSFRTYSFDGKLMKLVHSNKQNEIFAIRIHHGFIQVLFNENLLLQLNDIMINDGLWHDLEFSIDTIHSYYLLRLDRVFSDRMILSEKIHTNTSKDIIFGTDFHGCLGNLSINNQLISFQQDTSIELIGTTYGCELSEIIQDDLCSVYKPCYYGGECLNTDSFNFTCNCSKTRFTDRQCQTDLYPCASHPCSFDEQCISLNFNQSFTCISLMKQSKKSFYVGICFLIVFCLISILIVCYCKIERDRLKTDTISDQIDGTTQMLLKSEHQRKEASTSRPMSYHGQYLPVEYGLLSTDDLQNQHVYVNSMTDLTRKNHHDRHAFLLDNNRILTSSVSLAKAPIYARIVKTPRVADTFQNHSTNECTANRFRHASDSDLLNERKTTKFSSYFQTDV